MPQNMIATQKLFLVADRTALVREGDARAAFLFASPGDEITPAAAEQFGLIDGGLPDDGDLQAVFEAEAAARAAQDQADAEAAAAEEAARAWKIEEQQRAARAVAEASAKAEAEAAARSADNAASKPKPASRTKPKPAAETKDA